MKQACYLVLLSYAILVLAGYLGMASDCKSVIENFFRDCYEDSKAIFTSSNLRDKKDRGMRRLLTVVIHVSLCSFAAK